MFILTKLADLVQIPPSDFRKSAPQAIEDFINAKYANRVIQKIGLCICLYDLLSASEGLIGHGTGLVNVNVEFRVIVFRPFKHEVMLGKISSATESGIRIRTRFFDEIFIPKDNLPAGCTFSKKEQVFTWPTASCTLYYDTHETVRFRIESEIWTDQSPIGPSDSAGSLPFNTNTNTNTNSLEIKLEQGESGEGRGGEGGIGDGWRDKKSPYCLVGSMEDSGMGPCLWWDGEDEEEDGEEEIGEGEGEEMEI